MIADVCDRIRALPGRRYNAGGRLRREALPEDAGGGWGTFRGCGAVQP